MYFPYYQSLKELSYPVTEDVGHGGSRKKKDMIPLWKTFVIFDLIKCEVS